MSTDEDMLNVMPPEKKWTVSVWCEQYDLESGMEYIWSIPDDIIEVDSYEAAVKLREEILSGTGRFSDQIVHRCEIKEKIKL